MWRFSNIPWQLKPVTKMGNKCSPWLRQVHVHLWKTSRSSPLKYHFVAMVMVKTHPQQRNIQPANLTKVKMSNRNHPFPMLVFQGKVWFFPEKPWLFNSVASLNLQSDLTFLGRISSLQLDCKSLFEDVFFRFLFCDEFFQFCLRSWNVPGQFGVTSSRYWISSLVIVSLERP